MALHKGLLIPNPVPQQTQPWCIYIYDSTDLHVRIWDKRHTESSVLWLQASSIALGA